MRQSKTKIPSSLHTVSYFIQMIPKTSDTANEFIKDPIIFRGLKSLTQSNSQQNTLLRLAQEGISVYCPHTAIDAAPKGINTWLESVVTTPTQVETISRYSSSFLSPHQIIRSIISNLLPETSSLHSSPK